MHHCENDDTEENWVLKDGKTGKIHTFCTREKENIMYVVFPEGNFEPADCVSWIDENQYLILP